ncbi:MAG: hypothetical protein HY744_11110 [Deltaproteobacteria bacterium]|nr:hypothetical protein [Deltaproteobacteria bacterium]
MQTDRTPKRVFVLGVYASAVHAQWITDDGKVLVRALAVASEPYIFWRGDGVEQIVGRIPVPVGAGRLEPAAANLNGPSGTTLDDDILAPFGLARADAWLCDLVPHTCLNPKQKAALEREYEPRRAALGLPAFALPDVPKAFADDHRRQEVGAELEEAQASVVILLGDEPIRHWLRHFDPRWGRLSDFGEYGQLHAVKIAGRELAVLPLAHPRQVGALGSHSPKWHAAHERWRSSARTILDR